MAYEVERSRASGRKVDIGFPPEVYHKVCQSCVDLLFDQKAPNLLPHHIGQWFSDILLMFMIVLANLLL
jgi:hypothetical protein